MTIQLLDGSVLLNAGSVAMSSDCCCATCACPTGSTPTSCQYATAADQGPSAWSTLSGYQVDVSGTCTHRVVRDPLDFFDVCTPASCPCPSGTYVISCVATAYRIAEVVCEDDNNWYVTEVYFGMRPGTLHCNSNLSMFEVYLCSQTSPYAKSGSLPSYVGTGWQSVAFDNTGCGTYGNSFHKTWKNFTTGYSGWAQDLVGDCTSECATAICISDFPDSIAALAESNSLGGRRTGGCDPTGLTFAVQALA